MSRLRVVDPHDGRDRAAVMAVYETTDTQRPFLVPPAGDVAELAGVYGRQVDELAAVLERSAAALAEADRKHRAACEVVLAGLAELRGALEELADRAAACDEAVCSANWGVCPEHGNTLRSSGGRCWCNLPGCGRSWTTNRVGRHCTEPVVVIAADADGSRMRLCAGHWVDAQHRLVGVRLVRWVVSPPPGGDGAA